MMVTRAATIGRSPESRRDPAGYVFRVGGEVYRYVDPIHLDALHSLETSGLYEELAGAGLLVEHSRVDALSAGRGTVLKPSVIPFISYPFEWSPAQLRDAALLTLEIARRALARNMILRDADATNVQWRGTQPVFIDTLSFGTYREGEPWRAYRQFCEHFLAPLALMSRRDIRLGRMLQSMPDGMPLDLASRLLDPASWLSPSLVLHLHVHARAHRWFARVREDRLPGNAVSRRTLERLFDHLSMAIESIGPAKPGGWSDYASVNSYSGAARASKATIVERMAAQVGGFRALDLGANTGAFSALRGYDVVVAADADAAAVDLHYRRLRDARSWHVIPLVFDVLSPSPASGWANLERPALPARGRFDVVMMLALIHHLVVTFNVSLASIAEYVALLAPSAIIEFVPPDDNAFATLRARRSTAPHPYSESEFVRAFESRFRTVSRCPIDDSGRVIYLFERRHGS